MMGYDDRERRDRSAGLVVVLAVGLAILAALLFGFARKGHAQNQPSSCSGTAGVVAANITFGHPPSAYVFICDPSATASLWLSTTGTAAANASGSFALGPTVATATSGCVTLTPMPTISIIASAGSTPYTCFYR